MECIAHVSTPPFGVGQSRDSCFGPPHNGHRLPPVVAMAENDDIFAFFTSRSGSVENDDPGPFELLAIGVVSTAGGSAGIIGIIQVEALTEAWWFGVRTFHSWDKFICVAVMSWNFRGFLGFLAFFTYCVAFSPSQGPSSRRSRRSVVLRTRMLSCVGIPLLRRHPFSVPNEECQGHGRGSSTQGDP